MNLLRNYRFLWVFMMCALPFSEGRAANKNQCDMAAPTEINIIPETNEVAYDYARSLSDIQETKIDTVDPYGIHSNSITQGFMEGQISMKREVEMDYAAVKGGREVCLWYKKIDVNLHIDPKIVIAKEVRRSRCMRDAVLEHEHKHVDVDRAVVNQSAQELGKELYDQLSAEGFVVGPVPAAQAQARAERMVARVMQITEDNYKRLAERRARLQQEVDSLEEYERVKAECPTFYNNKKLLLKRALKAKQNAR